MTSQDNARRSPTAAAALAPVLRRQVADLRFRENDVRTHRPQGVHDFRVACRRLRAGLSGLEPLLDGRTCRVLADDLRRTARAVGPAWDAHVIRKQLDGTFLDIEHGGASRLHAQLVLLLERSESEGWQRAVEHLDHPAYDDLTRRLDRFADLPPWLTVADRPAEEVLRPLLGNEWSRFRRRAKAALEDSDDATVDERLHEARKASKRARYVAESTIGVLGRRAKRLAKAAEAVQEALGEHQDRIVTRAFLADVQPRLTLGGEDGQTMVLVREAQDTALATGWSDVRRVLKDADRKSLRAWMR